MAVLAVGGLGSSGNRADPHVTSITFESSIIGFGLKSHSGHLACLRF